MCSIGMSVESGRGGVRIHSRGDLTGSVMYRDTVDVQSSPDLVNSRVTASRMVSYGVTAS